MSELTYVESETKVTLTYCPMCGERGDELVIGEVYKYIGEHGENFGYGHAGGELAQALMLEGVKYIAHPLGDNEPAPGGHVCSDCSAEIAHQQKQFEAEVIRGGLHWTCEDCGQFGVIINDDSLGFCAATRGAAGVKPPNQLGVRFSDCEQHQTVEDMLPETDTQH